MSRALVTFLFTFLLVPAEILPQSSAPLALDGRPLQVTEELTLSSVPKGARPSSDAAPPASEPVVLPPSSPPLALDGHPLQVTGELTLASVPKRTSPLPDLAPPAPETQELTSPPPAFPGLKGRVAAVEGGMFAETAVWVSQLAEPSHRLVETSTDSRGNFTLRLPKEASMAGLVVRASTPSGYEGSELLDLLSSADSHALSLRLRKDEENYDEPSLDAVDDWLLARFKLAYGPKLDDDSASGMVRVLRQYRRRNTPAWERAAEIVEILGKNDTPDVRLAAAAVLMRLSAWQSAGEVLKGVEDPRFHHEKAVLEGVRLNFLRQPDEAKKLLESTLLDDSIDPFAQMELGRAAFMNEDWSGALQHFDPAMSDKELAPHAHYMRARCLFQLGDINAAGQEARLLTQRVGKKRLPLEVRLFVDDLREQKKGESVLAIRSVITQPLSELEKVVPTLAHLDDSPLPKGQDLAMILKEVGGNIQKFFREFSNTSSLEVLRQSHLDGEGRPLATRRREMYYVIQQSSLDGKPMLEEFRATPEGTLRAIGGLEDGFMVTTGFASSLVAFHPASQPNFDYRYLGRQALGANATYVVGFAQRPEDSSPMGVFRSPARQSAAEVYIQGLAWISADKFQVLRLRTDLLEPIEDVGLTRETSEVDYRPYHFLTTSTTYFLPSRVTVSIEWHKRRLRNEHIFSRFWLFNVRADSDDDGRVIRSQNRPQPLAAH